MIMSSSLLQTDKVLHLVTEYTEFGRENNLFFKKKALTVMDNFLILRFMKIWERIVLHIRAQAGQAKTCYSESNPIY